MVVQESPRVKLVKHPIRPWLLFLQKAENFRLFYLSLSHLPEKVPTLNGYKHHYLFYILFFEFVD